MEDPSGRLTALPPKEKPSPRAKMIPRSCRAKPGPPKRLLESRIVSAILFNSLHLQPDNKVPTQCSSETPCRISYDDLIRRCFTVCAGETIAETGSEMSRRLSTRGEDRPTPVHPGQQLS